VKIASMISAYPSVRAALLQRQQDFARQSGGAVLDGRDIGTVVAPEAAVKLFVSATPEVAPNAACASFSPRHGRPLRRRTCRYPRPRRARFRTQGRPSRAASDALLLDTAT